MRYFEVDSSDIALPDSWDADPVRLLRIGQQGRSVTGFCQSSRRCYIYPLVTPAGVAVPNERDVVDVVEQAGERAVVRRVEAMEQRARVGAPGRRRLRGASGQ